MSFSWPFLGEYGFASCPFDFRLVVMNLCMLLGRAKTFNVHDSISLNVSQICPKDTKKMWMMYVG